MCIKTFSGTCLLILLALCVGSITKFSRMIDGQNRLSRGHYFSINVLLFPLNFSHDKITGKNSISHFKVKKKKCHGTRIKFAEKLAELKIVNLHACQYVETYIHTYVFSSLQFLY